MHNRRLSGTLKAMPDNAAPRREPDDNPKGFDGKSRPRKEAGIEVLVGVVLATACIFATPFLYFAYLGLTVHLIDGGGNLGAGFQLLLITVAAYSALVYWFFRRRAL